MICQLSQKLQINMVHTYREGNESADGLSKLGSTQQNLEFWSVAALPRQIQASYFLDKLGVVAIRH
ncbi:hypothetical protein GIB67_016746 [Kingdonia uniflora]|uniref:RNase H type-1 domain-containing protein n=1 Tax=Kingdonia uniflora TaxID=39325 RepID=A0A7J7M8M9_9MAGN|nr:hypothetical protein GIB67_016746 [Kingdonia uniflora]